MVTFRSKKVLINSSSLEYIFLQDEKNSASSIIAHRSSMNPEVPWYLYVVGDPNEIS